MLPSPFDPNPSEEQLAQNLRDQIDAQVDYDWATFISAYALGRWNPLKTPQPPRSHIQPPTLAFSSRVLSRTAEGLDICDSPDPNSPIRSWDISDSDVQSLGEVLLQTSIDPLTKSAPPQYQMPTVMNTSSASSSPLPQLPEVGLATRRTTIPLNLAFSHRLRNSFADIRSSSTHANSDSRLPNTDVTTSAATIRLAAARVSVAPLALPSPEHELTDPFRGVTATIPGSHPSDLGGSVDPPLKSPNLTRKSRLSSFWQGTQDVEESRLPTIEASPPESTEDHTSQDESSRKSSSSFPFIGGIVPLATAPVRYGEEKEDDDYFGSLDTQRMLENYSSSSDRNSTTTQATTSVSRPDHEVSRHSSAPPLDEPATVPALRRRICLTRQTSAPLPTLAMVERLRSSRPASESSTHSHASRSAKEEQMYSELGYLAPPNPPNELDRRRALYK